MERSMKRKIVLIILCLLFILAIFYLQFSRKPTVNNSITSSDSEGYDATLTITMNKIIIFDRKKAEQTLIKQILDNDFKNMQFSYDVMGYPDELTVTVYTNNFTKYWGIPAFHFRYTPDN